MGCRELAEVVERKAGRMREELQAKLRGLREEAGGGQSRAESIMSSIVGVM